MALTIGSAAFEDGAPMATKYTCEGDDISPPLQWEGIPEGTRSLALIMDDPDAPVGIWVHWLLWNIRPDTRHIDENSVPDGAIQGLNSWERNSYGGPCPPSGTHRYFLKLFALDTDLNLPRTATKADLESAMQGHILAKTELMGTYSRSK